jgi:hypothetical protein
MRRPTPSAPAGACWRRAHKSLLPSRTILTRDCPLA